MPAPSLTNRFSNAIQSNAALQAQQIEELQTEITRLTSEHSSELEQALQSLRDKLQDQSGEHEVLLSTTVPNPEQPRQTLTQRSIETIAQTLKTDGQITPVILIQESHNPPSYTIFDGHRRIAGAKFLGWKTIRAVFTQKTEDLHRQALLTFLHHEDLNQLDKAEAIAKYLIMSADMDLEQIEAILSKLIKRLERQQRTKELTLLVGTEPSNWQPVLESWNLDSGELKLVRCMLALPINPSSFKANLLPMLYLAADLKEAIQQQGLNGAHALTLAGISGKRLGSSEEQATQERIQATTQVLSENLTVPQTRELIASIKAKFVGAQSSEPKLVTAFRRTLQKLSTDGLEAAEPEQLQELKQLLAEKMKQVEQLLQNCSG